MDEAKPPSPPADAASPDPAPEAAEGLVPFEKLSHDFETIEQSLMRVRSRTKATDPKA